MNDKQQLAALGEEMAERAMELFERKSPHQLAVELADAQKMCRAQAELLREIAKWILNGDAGEFGEVVRRIDAMLAGEVPGPVSQWIPCSERLPEPGVTVLIHQQTGYKDNTVTVIGRYVSRLTEPHYWGSDGADDWLEYDEEKDEYFCPEGWYENQHNWGEYSSLFISQPVTHWMPLPAAPKLQGGE